LDRVKGPSTLLVTGTCNEHVLVTKDDVTIQGGTYVGSEPDRSTIVVEGARRVVITEVRVGGKRNGVVVLRGGSLSLEKCTIENNPRTGVVAMQGSSATVNACTIQKNGGNGVLVYQASQALIDGNVVQENSGSGVLVQGASATLTNNQILSNGVKGIEVSNSGNARIGVDDSSQPAPNIIQSNDYGGIEITSSAAAYMLGNTILSNGLPTGRPGVGISRATGRLVGDNRIEASGRNGVEVNQGALFQGKGDFFNLTAGPDRIEGNPRHGISAFNGATLDIQNAIINGNGRNGISLTLNSSLRIRNSTVSGNARFGIGLELHSGVLFDDPPASVIGNTQAQVACRESTSKYDGNLSGVGQPIFCTAF
jgi:hypothetical protein